MYIGLESDYQRFSTAFENYAQSYFAQKRQLSHPECKIWESMSYSFFSSGKRFRPFIVYLVSEALGLQFNLVKSYALAVEMIHTYSLVHDDLPCMDNDDYRRGVPTNHKVFGESTALLAGDGLLTEAFLVISDDEELKSEQKIKAIRILSKMAGANGMISGQYLDMNAHIENDISFINHMLELKTANLIAAAASGVAGIANTDLETSLHQLFIKLGHAFQVKDDILDFNDKDQEAKSMAVKLGLTESQKILEILSLQITDGLQKLPIQSEKLVQLIQFNLERTK